MTQPQQAGRDQFAFRQYRTLLFSVVYRILGSAADAEDVVQDAWLKWSASDRSRVDDPKAYLTRIVSNLAMERLRSTRHQRETYVGPWLPEPVLTGPDTDRAGQRDVTERFLAAAKGGDINTLMELLSPDVTLWTDGGGKVHQALKPVVGPETVARWFAALGTVTYQGIEPGQMRAELTWINSGPGVVFRGPDRVIATLTFDFDPKGHISTIHNVANPDKLHAVADGTRHELSWSSARPSP